MKTIEHLHWLTIIPTITYSIKHSCFNGNTGSYSQYMIFQNATNEPVTMSAYITLFACFLFFMCIVYIMYLRLCMLYRFLSF